MAEAYIVEALRTPVGRKGGGLASVHPADLAGHVLTELLRRSASTMYASAISSLLASTIGQRL